MIDLTKYGTVTSEYGNRTSPTAGASTNHQGIDIVLKKDNIPAVVGGTVTASGYNSASGNYISILDSKGNTHTYKHLAERSTFKTGELVKEGETIGIQGSTGISTGKHLHYEVKTFDGGSVNPSTFFANGDITPTVQTSEKDGAIASGIKSVLSPVLTIILCIIIFIGAAFFLLKAFDISIPLSKEGLIQKGVEIIGK